MVKPILIGVGVVAFAAAVGGYAVSTGAPAAPKGGCPALVSVAPYSANFIAYADVTSLRNSKLANQMNSMPNAPLPAEFQEFVANTGFHFERDLDHVMIEGSMDLASGAIILEGRFDEQKISEFVAKSGHVTHYDAADVYLCPTHTAQGTLALIFLGPSRLAITMGKSAETQALILAGAAKRSDASSHEDLCERAERVSGAPFFMVGDVPKSAGLAMAALTARDNGGAADVLQSMQGWDLAFWSDGDNLRIAVEAEYTDRIAALRARLAFEKVRSALQKAQADSKSGPVGSSDAGAVVDSLVKNFGVSLDGHHVRMSTSLSQSDLESLQRTAALLAPHSPALPPRGR